MVKTLVPYRNDAQQQFADLVVDRVGADDWGVTKLCFGALNEAGTFVEDTAPLPCSLPLSTRTTAENTAGAKLAIIGVTDMGSGLAANVYTEANHLLVQNRDYLPANEIDPTVVLITDASEQVLMAAPGAGKVNRVQLLIISNRSATPTEVIFRSNSQVIARVPAPANYGGAVLELGQKGLKGANNSTITVALGVDADVAVTAAGVAN